MGERVVVCALILRASACVSVRTARVRSTRDLQSSLSRARRAD